MGCHQMCLKRQKILGKRLLQNVLFMCKHWTCSLRKSLGTPMCAARLTFFISNSPFFFLQQLILKDVLPTIYYLIKAIFIVLSLLFTICSCVNYFILVCIYLHTIVYRCYFSATFRRRLFFNIQITHIKPIYTQQHC
jgi:hypothetical protein